MPEAGRVQKQLKGMPGIQQVEQRMNENYIFAMASGLVGDELKFYFHCQLADKSGYVLAEIVFKQSLNAVAGIIKCTRGDLSLKVIGKLEEALSMLEPALP